MLMSILFQIGTASQPWITCTGLESVVEEMRSCGQDDISLINSALEEIVKELAEKSKPGDFWTSVAPLLPWKKHAQIREQLDRKWEDLKTKFSKKVHFIPKLAKLAFGSGDDDVHLVDKSRERYFNHVIESSIAAFIRERTDEESTGDDASMELDTHDQTIIQGTARTSTPVPVRQAKRKATTMFDEAIMAKRQRNRIELEDDVDYLTKRVEQRWRSDNLLFAKHDEQLDTLRNEKNLDKIVMNGVYIENLTGSLDEQRAMMFEAVTNILSSFMDDPPAPTFANHLNSQFRTSRRVLEVRFGNAERAILVRKTYAKKVMEFRAEKKFPEALNGVGIGMTLTKSTKIRIAILRGLAKIVDRNTEQHVKAYCMEYQTQPLLKVVLELDENRKTSRTYGFTEAIEHVAKHFGIKDEDLVEAYTLAGNATQLEQKFVVLRPHAGRRRNDQRLNY